MKEKLLFQIIFIHSFKYLILLKTRDEIFEENLKAIITFSMRVACAYASFVSMVFYVNYFLLSAFSIMISFN